MEESDYKNNYGSPQFPDLVKSYKTVTNNFYNDQQSPRAEQKSLMRDASMKL